MRQFVERLPSGTEIADSRVEIDEGAVGEVVEEEASADGLRVNGTAGGGRGSGVTGGGGFEERGESVAVGPDAMGEHLGEEAERGIGPVTVA